MNPIQILLKGPRFGVPFLFFCTSLISGCSVLSVKPSPDIANMEVAIRAAKEVSADVLAPELYRMALENGVRARREFRLKNFSVAREVADKARLYAEKAEYESIKNGGQREAIPTDPLADPSYQVEPIEPGSGDNPAAAAEPKASAAPSPSTP